MKTETKANIIIWSVATVMIAVSTFLMVLLLNEAFGTETPVGEPYLASYSYCAVTTHGVKGQSWCSQYKTGHEMRQKTEIKGLFFDGHGDRLVYNK